MAIDLETTGLSPRTDRIVEIGIVRFDGSGREVAAWTTLLDPQRDMGATSIHGIRSRDVIGAPTFHDAAADILGQLAGARVAAHNARFDLGFLTAEVERAGGQLGQAEAFCTMTVPYELGVVRSRRLSACCAELGIAMAHEHTALGDARATGAILLRTLTLARLSGDLPAIAPEWPAASPRVAAHLRGAPAPISESAFGPLADRVGLPTGLGISDEVGLAYLALLDRVLEDRRLTEAEVAALTEAAVTWGISATTAAGLHRAYLAGVGELALADGVITAAEQADLARLTELVGVGPASPSHLPSVRAPLRTESFRGQTVCFTGESVCTIDGALISRARQEELASGAGMIVRSGVSAQLDVLVLSDPDSASGKARKARELGIRRIAEPAFWRALGVTID